MRIGPSDRGNAIVEFVFLALICLVPLTYVVVSVAVVQRNTAAMTAAARDVGRAFVTSASRDEADRRVRAALRLALTDAGLPDDAELRFVSDGSDCDGPSVAPQLRPGAVFAVCVTRTVTMPGIPELLSGRGIRVVGRYVVHVDDFRTVG